MARREKPFRFWSVAGGSFRRAHVPRAAAGVCAFSFALMLFGLAAYFAAVPGLAAQSPLVQRYLHEEGASAAQGASADADQDGAWGESRAEENLDGSEGSAAGAADARLGASRVVVAAADMLADVAARGSDGAAAAGGQSTTSGGSAPSDVASQGSAPPSSSQSAPEPETDGLDEAAEARICAELRYCYDELDGYASQVYQFIADFNRLSKTGSQEQRIAQAQRVYDFLYTVQVADVAAIDRVGAAANPSDPGMPVTSRYIDNYNKLSYSYGRLTEALYQLDAAWTSNVALEDPTVDVAYWSGKMPVNPSTGKVIKMEEYEATRKGGRP
ncbi:MULTISPECIES: hypothetical protein [unclassified Adlercreutzia]|uniref:hypothetical protein n=1 Tax=unclassified Adlercreutzia TaxID=2636013 RepID=UPI0013EE1A40|nr:MULTISPECIES: hypothetical protein [unclassified Adlercreutzia]